MRHRQLAEQDGVGRILKIAVLAPMPRAKLKAVTAGNPGRRRKMRAP
jgi:hypothetical protein